VLLRLKRQASRHEFCSSSVQSPPTPSLPPSLSLRSAGKHTDYNEGFVFPLALDLRTFVVGRGSLLVRPPNQKVPLTHRTHPSLPPSLPPSSPLQANTPITTKASSFPLPWTCAPLSWAVAPCSSAHPTKKCL